MAHERVMGRAEGIPLRGINLMDGIDKVNLHGLFLKTCNRAFAIEAAGSCAGFYKGRL
jgi:hypothetical protein